jgi:hypothetical protein
MAMDSAVLAPRELKLERPGPRTVHHLKEDAAEADDPECEHSELRERSLQVVFHSHIRVPRPITS